MGLFAKVNETARPGAPPAHPATALVSNQGSRDSEADHPGQGGLFVRARAYTKDFAGSDRDNCEQTPDEVIYDTCKDRLQRVSPGDHDTAISILKTFYPLDTMLFMTAPLTATKIYASCGMESGPGIFENLEKRIASSFPDLVRTCTDEGMILLSKEDVPPALLQRKKENFFLLPLAKGDRAWALLSKPEGDEAPVEVSRFLAGSLSDRFLPLGPVHRTLKEGSSPKRDSLHTNTQTEGPTAPTEEHRQLYTEVLALFDTDISAKDVLLVEQLAEASLIADRALRAVPETFHVLALNSTSLVLAAPASFDVELVWHHLLRIALSGSNAQHGRVTLLPSVDRAALATALGDRGYGDSPR